MAVRAQAQVSREQLAKGSGPVQAGLLERQHPIDELARIQFEEIWRLHEGFSCDWYTKINHRHLFLLALRFTPVSVAPVAYHRHALKKLTRIVEDEVSRSHPDKAKGILRYLEGYEKSLDITEAQYNAARRSSRRG